MIDTYITEEQAIEEGFQTLAGPFFQNQEKAIANAIIADAKRKQRSYTWVQINRKKKKLCYEIWQK